LVSRLHQLIMQWLEHGWHRCGSVELHGVGS
jgi:hypothetical protein